MTSFKLFLFDLDGTLVSTGGAGLRALGRAFHELYGIENAYKKINPAGKTDPAIFREILRIFFNREMSAQEFADISACYLKHLESEMKSGVRALDGVHDFVNHIAHRADILVGLGTGNLERGARLKLAPTELNDLFEFGGFGSDAEERSDVLKHGHRRAQEKIRQDIHPSSVFVIGDTPLDVSAARRAGFQAVAVASGSYPYEELRHTRPDFLIRSMADGNLFLDQVDQLFSGVSS